MPWFVVVTLGEEVVDIVYVFPWKGILAKRLIEAAIAAVQ